MSTAARSCGEPRELARSCTCLFLRHCKDALTILSLMIDASALHGSHFARNAITFHERWQQLWRSPKPRAQYDVVIVGSGRHGLASTHLANEYGIRNVAVVEKERPGGGNTGHNAHNRALELFLSVEPVLSCAMLSMATGIYVASHIGASS